MNDCLQDKDGIFKSFAFPCSKRYPMVCESVRPTFKPNFYNKNADLREDMINNPLISSNGNIVFLLFFLAFEFEFGRLLFNAYLPVCLPSGLSCLCFVMSVCIHSKIEQSEPRSASGEMHVVFSVYPYRSSNSVVMFRVSSVNLWAKRLPRQVFHITLPEAVSLTRAQSPGTPF